MGKAHSEDLRQRVVAEVAAGASRRQAAERFKVGISSAIRWVSLKEETGGVAPRPRGGKSRSPLEPHADWLLQLTRAQPDLTLEAIVTKCEKEIGIETSEASLRRFFKRHAITFKKKPARGRTGAARRGASPRTLEGRPGRPRPDKTGVRR
jgi:transposase